MVEFCTKCGSILKKGYCRQCNPRPPPPKLIITPDHPPLPNKIETIQESPKKNKIIRNESQFQRDPSCPWKFVRLSLPLWPNQQDAVDAWLKNNRHGIIEMATGTGKTLVGLACIQRTLDELLNTQEYIFPHPRILIICHSNALLDQWRDQVKAKVQLNRRKFERYVGNHLAIHRAFSAITVEFVTFQKIIYDLKNKGEEETYKRYRCELMLIDEIHHAGGAQFQKVARIPHKALLGLSATIEGVTKTQILVENFGNIIYSFGLAQAIDQQVLPVFEFYIHYVELSNEELDKFAEYSENLEPLLDLVANQRRLVEQLFKSHGLDPDDYAEEFQLRNLADFFQLIDIARYHGFSSRLPRYWRILEIYILNRRNLIHNSQNKLTKAVELIQEFGLQKKCVLFHMNIQACENIAKELINAGLSIFLLHSDYNLTTNRETLEKFKNCDKGILISPKMLDEGLDIPDAEIGINISYTLSKLQSIQRMGRILRKFPGKKPQFHQILLYTKQPLGDLSYETMRGLIQEQNFIKKMVSCFPSSVEIYDNKPIEVKRLEAIFNSQNAQGIVRKSKGPVTIQGLLLKLGFDIINYIKHMSKSSDPSLDYSALGIQKSQKTSKSTHSRNTSVVLVKAQTDKSKKLNSKSSISENNAKTGQKKNKKNKNVEKNRGNLLQDIKDFNRPPLRPVEYIMDYLARTYRFDMSIINVKNGSGDGSMKYVRFRQIPQVKKRKIQSLVGRGRSIKAATLDLYRKFCTATGILYK
jgi:superfamily II DNA or RNA helicase